MEVQDKLIRAFAKLGDIMMDSSAETQSSAEAKKLRSVMDSQEEKNKWFTPGNVNLAVRSIAEMLRADRLEQWLSVYDLHKGRSSGGTVAVIMAGNIPLVGFHDFMCVLMAGHTILARTSHKDDELIKELAAILVRLEPSMEGKIRFTGKISGSYDAVIATGSDNTARYFDYYFGKKPHIFRKNRNSVAIIDKNTSAKQLKLLASDIFTYFGLGCRNVSKLYIEEGIKPEDIVSYWDDWSGIIMHRPYANNYLYNKSLLTINRNSDFTDTGYALLNMDGGFASPVSVINYEHYTDRQNLESGLSGQSDLLQCVVSGKDLGFGKTQQPGPGDYADNVDTMEFLISL
ncbi:MAG: acyl-CoA reductase [Bacteroidales bacterium]|nr:acyl-CoA reductase [Bacteroidales bacterium]